MTDGKSDHNESTYLGKFTLIGMPTVDQRPYPLAEAHSPPAPGTLLLRPGMSIRLRVRGSTGEFAAPPSSFSSRSKRHGEGADDLCFCMVLWQ